MSKTYKQPKKRRNLEVMAMIAAGTGRGGFMRDKRQKRDKEKSWKREDFEDDDR